ncbi:hypothetical protein [Streptococcus marimammalium]|uniref:hypothetical protein n=1 Tax=Streptococcus marimammalium TaxID=269666 RepID=UPI00047555B6|nr:hypothetical protein [Streptococcus marimammalium]
MKKILRICLGLLFAIVILGGCSMTSQEETLTKEQQDNVVKMVARNYNINKIEFVHFEKDLSTGTYDLYFRVNDKQDGPMLPIEKLEELDTDQGAIGLDPIVDYEDIIKNEDFDKESPVDISDITIIYLKE